LLLHKNNGNILDESMLDHMFKLLDFTSKMNLLIFYSLNENEFLVGEDIKKLCNIKSRQDGYDWARKKQKLFNRIESLETPSTIAAIHGKCIGVGVELALSCSYRICSNHKNTYFAFPEIKLGMIPSGGACIRLPSLIGIHHAIQLILFGVHVTPSKALKIGLIDKIVPFHNFFSNVEKFVTSSLDKDNIKHSVCQE